MINKSKDGLISLRQALLALGYERAYRGSGNHLRALVKKLAGRAGIPIRSRELSGRIYAKIPAASLDDLRREHERWKAEGRGLRGRPRGPRPAASGREAQS